MADANWANQTMWTADNLDVLRGMNSASVDLIYLDPPFNSGHDYAAPIGSRAAGAEFKDTWGLDDVNLAWHGEIKHERPALYALLLATQQIHGDSMMSYLIYMAARLLELHRVLKPTGSLYLHCDPFASHYLKLLTDSIFGQRHFKNEITWKRTVSHNDVKRNYGAVSDVMLFYVKSDDMTFSTQYAPYSAEQIAKTYRHVDEHGRRYATSNIRSPKPRPNLTYAYKGYQPHRNGWTVSKERMAQLDSEGRLHFPRSKDGRIRLKLFLDEMPGVPIGNVWDDIRPIQSHAKERVGYPTQKPLALLRRIIEASAPPDGVVLDPFCGCATACIAAEQLGRQWAGIDISPKAADLVQDRMQRELGLFYQGAIRTDVPTRTDLGRVIRYNDARNKRWLYGEQGGYCNGCAEHFQAQHLTVDHIIARRKGGTDHISNLQLLCHACNSLKGTKSHAHLLACLTDKGWIKRERAA